MSGSIQVQPANLSREMAKKAQHDFMMRGGTYEIGLAMHMATGHVQKVYEYREYPKMLYLNPRQVEDVTMVETCDKRMVESRVTRTVYDEVVVKDEDEEERILAGGRSSADLEQERQTLLARARAMNIKADVSWSVVRLKRELGEALDAPSPGDDMAKLEAELTNLRKLAAMQKEIEALRAQLGAVDDPADLRSQLTALGVTVDRRWGAARMREELERATAP